MLKEKGNITVSKPKKFIYYSNYFMKCTVGQGLKRLLSSESRNFFHLKFFSSRMFYWKEIYNHGALRSSGIQNYLVSIVSA